MKTEIQNAAESCYIKGRYRSYLEAHVTGFDIGYNLATQSTASLQKELEEARKRIGELEEAIKSYETVLRRNNL